MSLSVSQLLFSYRFEQKTSENILLLHIDMLTTFMYTHAHTHIRTHTDTLVVQVVVLVLRVPETRGHRPPALSR